MVRLVAWLLALLQRNGSMPVLVLRSSAGSAAWETSTIERKKRTSPVSLGQWCDVSNNQVSHSCKIDGNAPVRCFHEEAKPRLKSVIEQARALGDSVGGCITCVCRGVPPGWGEPVFQKLEADLARAMLSIPATKVCTHLFIKTLGV